MTSSLLTILILSALLSTALAQGSDQCRCRRVEQEDPCATIVSTGDGSTCRTITEGCNGCICDEEGALECDLDSSASSYQYLAPGQPQCEMRSSIRTNCPDTGAATLAPAPTTAEPTQRMLEDKCSIDRPLSWKDYTCDVVCFPPSYGSIYEMEIEFFGKFMGTYSVTADEDIPSGTLVRITPSVIAEVTHEGTYILNDEVSSRAGVQTDIRAGPRFSQSGFAAGSVETGNVEGEQTELASNPPADGYDSYVCDGSESITSFVILAEITNSITGSLQATTEGEFYANISIKYFFESTGNFGVPVV